jgi:ribonuclease P protein component
LRVQSVGERTPTAHFVLLVARTSEAEGDLPAPARFGVVVTKRIGNAVARNRVKRVCRECFRLWPDLVPNGVDLVVIARDGAHELGLEEVRREWERARPRLLERCARVLESARSFPLAR